MASEGFQDLVRRAQDGDRAAMDQVLEIMRPYIDQMARPYADSARPAESTADLRQDTCLRAWKKIKLFKGGENDEETFRMFQGWIGQMARNLSRTAKRDRDRQKKIPPKKMVSIDQKQPGQSTTHAGITLPSGDPSPTEMVRTDEIVRRVQEALGKITDETEAEILRLRFIEEVSLLEISRRLGMTYKKVRHRSNSALAHLEQDVGDLI
ncbi:MAG: sigma-70 family RNA polymerase sigma factor [Planctomycetota bacterium]|nr:sigma-70 family RNA polymerase sigma factor [Planctomycetota bacterium]